MSTERHNTGHAEFRLPLHEDVAFETKDVQTRPIFKFLSGLAIVIVLSYGASWIIYKGLIRYWTSSYEAPPPSRAQLGLIYPPEPRLQGMPGHMDDPQLDLRNKLAADRAANEKFAWIDQKDGIAQIPVKEAMKIIAEKGLPVVTPAPAVGKK
jgi:hypothetical protein